jgi:DNA ligase (NAD+)
MLSLESVTDADAVRRFDERIWERARAREVRYVLQPKLDGLSLEVVYRDGVLLRASTRGDRQRGEGVTENVRTIRSVPLRLRGQSLPRLLAVRGEAIMRLDDFRALNAGLEKAGEALFANPRNAAAGSIRQLDLRVTATRRLDVFFYDILHMEGGPRLTTDTGVLQALASWGLHTTPYTRPSKNLDDVSRYHSEMAQRRESFGYEIDGIVLKVEDLTLRERLQTTARHPRWALAYKFVAREKKTTIEDIGVQVGRTGVLTPVAILRPVQIGGVTRRRGDRSCRRGCGAGRQVRESAGSGRSDHQRARISEAGRRTRLKERSRGARSGVLGPPRRAERATEEGTPE